MTKLSLTQQFERLQNQKKGLEHRRATKVPVVILADTSFSMTDPSGVDGLRKIDSLNKGIETYFQQMKDDSVSTRHVDVAIITFGHHEVELSVDFAPIEKQDIPEFEGDGGTPMCEAISLGINILETQLELYASTGIPHHQPHMIILTDGYPTQSGVYDELDRAVPLNKTDDEFKLTKKAFDEFKQNFGLVAITVAIGEDIKDSFYLEQFATDPTKVLKLENHNIVDFFNILSRSTTILSRSMPSEDIKMEFDKVDSKGIVKMFN